MHQVDFDINLDEIAKIEGHAGLKVQVRGGQVTELKFEVLEYKRFYTQGMRGKKAENVPQFVARICGTCSNAHLLASIEAAENALGITRTPQTQLLNQLVVNGLMIRDHALHLYIFALPDIFGVDSIVDFDENNPDQHQFLHDALAVKSAGNALQVYLAGRSVHAPNMAVGGYIKLPTESPDKIITQLQGVREAVIRLINIFAQRGEQFNRDTTFMALRGANAWSLLEGSIINSVGENIPESEFKNHLEHVVIPYSQASGWHYGGKEYFTGALARLNLNKDQLHPKTQESCKELLQQFPSTNIFYNNVAQAIETLHCIDESIDLLTNRQWVSEPRQMPTRQDGIGVGVIEAPRGLLFYKLEVEAGVVKNGEVVIPTGQNQVNIEKDIGKLIQENLQLPQDQLVYKIEKLIRAYDPCMSCAAHFLEVEWDIK